MIQKSFKFIYLFLCCFFLLFIVRTESLDEIYYQQDYHWLYISLVFSVIISFCYTFFKVSK